MKNQEWRHAVLPVLLSLVYVNTVFAEPVKVTARSKSGAPSADTIIVFDPLDTTPPASHDAAIVDQVNKTFVPHVSIVRTGTAVAFPNSDRIRHQVYSFSPSHPFTLKLYAGSPRTDIIFDKPGMVVLGCNIHDSMVGFIAVVNSPYFAKIPASGIVDMDLPPGHYRLRVWNSNMTVAVPSQDITVAAAPIAIALQVDLDPAHVTDVGWPE
jgi:plastocyanin